MKFTATFLPLLAAGSLLLALTPAGALAQAAAPPPEATPKAPAKVAAKPSTAATATGGAFTAADKKLLKAAAQSDETEIAFAKLALQKAESSEVKKYAQTMLDEHGKTSTQLQPLADAAGMTKPDLKPKHKTALAKLETLSGGKFDLAYVELNAKSHKETAERMKRLAPAVTNPDVKTFATATLPVVEHHAMMAQEMSTKMGAGAGSKKKDGA